MVIPMRCSAGTKYVGGFKNGRFHGKGTLYIPECGAYEAVWENGREVEGSYTFADGLPFQQQERWDYCTPADRRFFDERQSGMRHAGTGSAAGGPPLPTGCFDVGDGYLDGEGTVHDFASGRPIRRASDAEVAWAHSKCRVGR